MPRIIVIGCGGAGKSLFSKHLGKVLGIPVVHLDKIFWKPGWEQVSREEFVQAQQAILEGRDWIIDGNYGGTMELRMAAADTIVFLDMSTYLCLWGAVKTLGSVPLLWTRPT